MPKKTITSLFDDLDGKELPEDTAPITLSMGRTTYNLYLSETNHGKLLKALDPFIKDAETVSTNAAPRKTAAASGADKEEQKAIRAWAIETGFKYKNAAGEEKTLGDRGRIPDAVVKGWKDAGSPALGA